MSGMSYSSLRCVLCIVLTRHLGVPIGEHTARVLLPRPDMQFIERRDAVAIRGTDIVENLTHQCRWGLMAGIPGFGDDNIFHTDKSEMPVSYRASGRKASISPSPTNSPFTKWIPIAPS